MQNQRSHKLTILIPTLFALLVCLKLQAEETASEPPWYQVEVLLFERTTPLDPEGEQFDQDFVWPSEADTQRLTPLPRPPDETETGDEGPVQTGLAAPEVARSAPPEGLVVAPALQPTAGLEAAPPASTDQLPQGRPAERPYQLLPEEQFGLMPEEIAIRRSTRYVLLDHLAWRQPVREHDQTRPVWIDTRREPEPEPAPETIPETVPETVPETTPEAAANTTSGSVSGNVIPRIFGPLLGSLAALHAEEITAEEDATTPADQSPGAVPEPEPEPEPLEPDHIRGRLSISLSRYLHVAADLVYQRQRPEEVGLIEPVTGQSANQTLPLVSLTPAVEEAVPEQTPDTEPLETKSVSPYLAYPLVQKRRVRRDKLNYFDHPAFGILIKLTPYEPKLPLAEPPE